jgi:hypothetical protein
MALTIGTQLGFHEIKVHEQWRKKSDSKDSLGSVENQGHNISFLQ